MADSISIIYCPDSMKRKKMYELIESQNKVGVGYYDKSKKSEERVYGICDDCTHYYNSKSKWKNLDYCHSKGFERERLWICGDCLSMMGSEFDTKSYHKNNCILVGNSYDEIIQYARKNAIPLRTFRKSRIVRKNKRQKNKVYEETRKRGNDNFSFDDDFY